MENHEQTKVIVYDQINGCTRTFLCDKSLAPLLSELNRIGAVTNFSCENINNSGAVQIGFDHSVPTEILMHAETRIAAAYPDRYIIRDINDSFDPIILAFKHLNDISTIVAVYKFNQEIGGMDYLQSIKFQERSE